MNNNLGFNVRLTLTDGMSGPASKAMSTLSAESSRTNRAMRADHERMSKAREMLGIRPEQTIQREIRRTEAAYRRLSASGTLSWREQVRAAGAMHRQVATLNKELGKMSTLQKAVGLAAAATAAGFVIKPMADKAMSYDLRLAHMSNTAFADRDPAGRKSGMRDLDKTIIDAVRKGGGTRDQAAETLDTLIASGAMSIPDAMGLLPTLMKSSTGTNANGADLAQIAIRGMQTFKIKAQDLPKMIDMGIASGQAGGFELKDMAKWLPQQMAAASMLGLSGTQGFAKLASLNQASVITAGSKDEAGNNLVNLLAKISSADTAKDAEKLGINLPKYLAEKRAKGVDSVDAFVGLVDSTVSKKKAWKDLQARMSLAKDDAEKRETLESMATIVQGSSIGQFVQDRQALMALVAIMNNRGYLADVQAKTLNSAGAADTNFSVISDTAAFKSSQKDNEIQFGQQEAMNKLLPMMGALSDKVVELAREYPNLTTATVAATGALTALAAAAGAAGMANIFTGGGNGGGVIGGTVGRAGKLFGGMLRSAGGFAAKRALPLWGAWEAGQWAGENIFNPMVNSGVSWMTGKENTLGGAIYDLQQKFNGQIRIKVDQDARVSSVTARTDNPRIPMNVDAGFLMLNP